MIALVPYRFLGVSVSAEEAPTSGRGVALASDLGP